MSKPNNSDYEELKRWIEIEVPKIHSSYEFHLMKSMFLLGLKVFLISFKAGEDHYIMSSKERKSIIHKIEIFLLLV
jgi:hypothetical protein